MSDSQIRFITRRVRKTLFFRIRSEELFVLKLSVIRNIYKCPHLGPRHTGKTPHKQLETLTT